jgi:hypothetical protein
MKAISLGSRVSTSLLVAHRNDFHDLLAGLNETTYRRHEVVDDPIDGRAKLKPAGPRRPR